MLPLEFGFLANDHLPPREEIIAICKKQGWSGRVFLRNPSQPGDSPIAYVKYSSFPNTIIDEALTQDWVAKSLSDPASPGHGILRVPRVYDAFSVPSSITLSWPMGIIVMEYIDAPDCTEKHVKLVAQAVQTLISIRGPSSAPGHIGEGPVVHTFFNDDQTSPFRYKTVDELEQHINGILKVKKDVRRLTGLVTDASEGLYFCPCDIKPSNFKELPDGKIAVMDFRESCFLPPCFFAIAMEAAFDSFTRKVARRVKYPISDDIDFLLINSACYFLVLCGRNDIGASKRLRQRRERQIMKTSSTIP
ncbi:hypothetical protein BT96DRAFT_601418 [Gymnopus androsaceus JB14]|uniref:Aminoglycoside phosphotransferase domain-containing protein n=1 Tax=Gymnopus androsaceus JB14 TaxID=1447944 RepID=A0A6A4GIA1_9AGAR|nr:hypothetical protein BT96DRAFT_601418 [Gymnopus androsaceus JB14]